MYKDRLCSGWSISHITAGLAAIIVGYTCSVVIVIEAVKAVGATTEQISSCLFALGILMGITTISYSLAYRTPILTAWSTPGAAMLIGSVHGYTIYEMIGACIASAFLILLTGMTGTLNKLLQKIPTEISTAMLAGVLLPFGIKAFTPIATAPALFGGMFLSYLIGRRFMPRYTMLLLLCSGLVIAYTSGGLDVSSVNFTPSYPVFIAPQWNLQAILSLGIPLYLITMISQNLPGIVMLTSHHYKAPVSKILAGTGIMNMLFAPIGGLTCNLAAITAGICMGEEAGHRHDKRYLAAVSGGLFYLLAGIGGASIVALFTAMPEELTQMLAGFALIGTILMCFQEAMKTPSKREAALVTLLITTSGISYIGISSTLLGICGGCLIDKILKK